MGRSVNVPSGSVVVIYFPARFHSSEDEDFTDDDYQWEWDDMVRDIQYSLKQSYPSLEDSDRWCDREGHVILENKVIDVVLSEYCGLCSLSLVPKDEPEYTWKPLAEANFAEAWATKVANGFRRVLHDDCGLDLYNRVGRFSNGESVYERASL
jgi:hypothetical protein